MLVQLQLLVWAGLAILNLNNYQDVRAKGTVQRGPWGFVAAVYGVIVIIIGSAQWLGLVAPDDSTLSGAGMALQVLGALAVLPALLALSRIRAVGEEDALWVRPSHDLELMRFLRRRVKPAVASVGVVIGLAIVATTQIVSVTRAPEEGQPPLVLLYGGFFTAVLFAMYIYVVAGLDQRSRRLIDNMIGPVDPADWASFQQAEEQRSAFESAYGIGTSTRESFQGLVAVTTPLLGALTAFYIG